MVGNESASSGDLKSTFTFMRLADIYSKRLYIFHAFSGNQTDDPATVVKSFTVTGFGTVPHVSGFYPRPQKMLLKPFISHFFAVRLLHCRLSDMCGVREYKPNNFLRQKVKIIKKFQVVARRQHSGKRSAPFSPALGLLV